MDDNIILLILGFIGTLIVVMSPIIKLNNTITKLNVVIDNVIEKIAVSDCTISVHSEKINNHEIRIDRLERKV